MILVDGHSDILIDVVQRHLKGNKSTLKNVHLPKLRAGGVDVLVCPIACDNPRSLPSDAVSTLKHLDIISREIEEIGDDMTIVRSLDDIQKAKDGGRIGVILSMEGANPVEGSIERLRMFYERGLRWMQPTWNVRNKIGVELSPLRCDTKKIQKPTSSVNRACAFSLSASLIPCWNGDSLSTLNGGHTSTAGLRIHGSSSSQYSDDGDTKSSSTS